MGIGVTIAVLSDIDLETGETGERARQLRPVSRLGNALTWSGAWLVNGGALYARSANRAAGSSDNALLGGLGLGCAAMATGLGVTWMALGGEEGSLGLGLVGNFSGAFALGSFVLGTAQLVKNTNVRRNLRDKGLVHAAPPPRLRVGLAISPGSVGLRGTW